jgi:hypothetical protein
MATRITAKERYFRRIRYRLRPKAKKRFRGVLHKEGEFLSGEEFKKALDGVWSRESWKGLI